MASQQFVYLHYQITPAEAHTIRLRVEAYRAQGCTNTTAEMQRAWVSSPPNIDANAIRDALDAGVHGTDRPVVIADATAITRRVSGCLALPTTDAQAVEERAHMVGMEASEYLRRMLLGLPVWSPGDGLSRDGLWGLLFYVEREALAEAYSPTGATR